MFPWCLVALQKIFRKIFSGVWKRRRKTPIQKNTSHNPRQIQSDDRAVDRRRDRDLGARSRLLREIAIHGAIAIDATRSRSREALRRSRSTRRDRDLAKHGTIAIDAARSRSTLSNRRRGLELDWVRRQPSDWTGARLPHARSLSPFFRNSFEVNIGTEIHFCGQSLFFSVNGFQFPENRIFRTNQTHLFSGKSFPESL